MKRVFKKSTNFKMKDYKISMREYKGMYFVEFDSKSLGCTLLATWDKKQAEAEYNRFNGMSKQQISEYLKGGKTA